MKRLFALTLLALAMATPVPAFAEDASGSETPCNIPAGQVRN